MKMPLGSTLIAEAVARSSTSHSGHAPQTRRIIPVPMSIARLQEAGVNISRKGRTDRPRATPDAGQSEIRRNYHPRTMDVYLLGITIVIGGQYFGWTAGFGAGIYNYLIGFFVISVAYFTFCCCMSELSGALPFAGGSYGLARCTLGFYPAFLIGCSEALMYMMAVATITLSLGRMITSVAPTLEGVEPVIWIAFYLLTLILQIRGDHWFWISNAFLGIVSFLILVLYCIVSVPYADFAWNAIHQDEVVVIGGISEFLNALPNGTWLYIGVEALNFASDEVSDPKMMIPRSQLACMSTLFFTALTTFLITVSLPVKGGISALAASLSPLDNGFMRGLGATQATSTLLSIPATYATAFGFMWCPPKLLHAMATSRLIPWQLGKTSVRFGTPYVAAISSALLSFAICVVVFEYPHLEPSVFPMCLLFAFLSYSGQCVGYVTLRRKYPLTRQSTCRNPLGIYGAVCSLSIWLLCIVSLVLYQDFVGLYVLVGLVIVLTIYYFAWAKKRQVISAEENKVLLSTHIWRYNGIRKRTRRSAETRRSSGGSLHRLSKLSVVSRKLLHSQGTGRTLTTNNPSAVYKTSRVLSTTGDA